MFCSRVRVYEESSLYGQASWQVADHWICDSLSGNDLTFCRPNEQPCHICGDLTIWAQKYDIILGLLTSGYYGYYEVHVNLVRICTWLMWASANGMEWTSPLSVLTRQSWVPVHLYFPNKYFSRVNSPIKATYIMAIWIHYFLCMKVSQHYLNMCFNLALTW